MDRRQVAELYNQAERLRDNPGRYFPALDRAEKAMGEWRAGHPTEAAAEDKAAAAYRASEKARRDEDYKNSFIGRGLD